MSKIRECVSSHSLFTSSRLYSLYSDFRKLKEVNPDGFEANLIAWKSLIESLFQKHVFRDTFVLSTEGLLEELTLANYGKPLSLNIVLDHLIASGDLIPLKPYQQRTDSIYSKKWVRPVLNWTVNRFLFDTSYKTGDKKHNLKPDQLISKKSLEEYVKELEKKRGAEDVSGHSHTVFTKLELQSYLNSLGIYLFGESVQLSELDYQILLTYLSRDVNKVKIKENVVKFGSEEISEEDISIAEIKTTLKSLNSKSDELQFKIQSLSEKLQESLKNKNNKDLSLNLLRSRKLAEKSLATQMSLTSQLESVMYKIDESSSNVQLLKALENGTVILKSLNTQIGGVDRVEKIIDNLEEEKGQSDKIASELYRLGPDVDDEEVEAEFEEMLSQEKKKSTESKNTGKESRLFEKDLAEKLAQLEISPNGIEKEEKEGSKEALHS